MPKPLTTSLHNFTSKRVVRRSVIGLALFLLVFSIFGWLILPGIVKSQAERLIGEKLQREVSIGAVEISPYAMALTVRDFKLMEPQRDAVFASFEALSVNVSLQSVLRLAPVVQELRLTKPYVHLVRKDAHSYNFDDILAIIASQPPSEETARFSINNIQLEGGSIHFDDKPAKSIHTVEDLRLGVPFISSLPSQVDIFVEPLLSAKVNGTPLQFKGKARPFADTKDALLDLNLDGLDATRVMEYLPFKPRFKLPSARLDLHLTANFSQPKNKAPAVTLSGTAALKSVLITELDGKQIFKLPAMTVSLHDMDVFGSRFEIARLSLDGLEANLVRGGDGQLNIARLLPAAAANSAPAASSAKAAPDASGLGIALGELDIRGAALRYTDENSARPMQAGVEKFDLALRKLAVDTRKKTINIGEVVSDQAGFLLSQGKPQAEAGTAATAAAVREKGAKDETSKGSKKEAPYAVQVGKVDISNWSARIEDRSHQEPIVTQVAPLAVSMHDLSTAEASRGRIELKATVNKTGQLALNGSLGIAPLHTDLALELKGVDILPLQPYMTDKVNLRLTHASLSGKGRLQLDAEGGGPLKGGFKGDMTLGNVATVDKISGNDFLRWKSLYFGGVDAQLEPFKLAVDQVALTDFFARVIINSSGRINLQDIARSHADDRKSLTEPSRQAGAAPKAAPAKGEAVAAATAKQPDSATPSAPLPIAIRKLSLQGGRVRFTDNFIQPNYSASLSNFGGVVTNLSSDASTSAGVDLHAEVNNAPLSVAGRINPLKGDLFMDLKAKVHGMELAPLSAYSGRYVGYGIEKGRLSFEVAYLVDQRKLTAENRLILEQITFGEKIESPSATKLPVQFAVALLRDRNGVIDINLPIAGSLDDPQFSVGGILLKVIGNLIVKAVTQPFAVLGALFGGGAELSSLEFDAGRATISAAGEEKLKTLAKALGDRPALTLDITGHVDPETDRAGLKRVSVERKVRAIKVGDLTAKGESVAPGSVVVQAAEYPALLLRAYKAEKFPKPRNMIGLPKDLPVEEMEKLMIANASIDDDDLVNLGNQRAQSVKNWLIKNGQIPADRMFLIAPKVGSQEAQKAALAPNRVDFSLR
ncbi:MAG TPA: DUF748 domain-containing protein [Noviherbaspirillum sp.]|nr:DUF748 domain-containing protein [Noviherbaspirillum sp.]